MERSKKIGIIVGLVFVILVCAVGGYYYYKRTPTYTLSLIQESVQKHDWETFSKHIDTESVFSSGVDDIIELYIDESDSDDGIKSLAKGFVEMLKPTMVQALNDGVKDWVKTGEWQSSQESNGSKELQDKKAIANDITKDTNLDELKFKGVGDVSKDGNTATVELKLTDMKLNRDTTLKVLMNQLDDGTWKIVKIVNLKEYIKEEKKALEDKLAELNKPIYDEINSTVTMGEVQSKINNKNRFSPMLVISAPIQISGNKQINSIEGELQIKNANGKINKQPFKVDLQVKTGASMLNINCKLNPFENITQELLKGDMSQFDFKIDIQKLMYSDGESLETKKSLDD